VQTVDFGNPDRERTEMLQLHREQLARHSAEMLLVGAVNAVAPQPEIRTNPSDYLIDTPARTAGFWPARAAEAIINLNMP
jgi:hypothetical protein